METSASQTSNSASSTERPAGTFSHLKLVLGVAFVLATLFTAWTPSVLLPGKPGQNFAFQPPLFSSTSESEQNATPTARPRPLVGIVAGHSGNDSGSVCPDGLTEVFVNETIAGYVQKYLIERSVDVEVLKEFDPQLRGFKASALVSIHADSCDYINDQATGFKVAAALSNPHPERAARLTACLRSRYAQITKLPLHSTSVTNDMTSYHAFGEIDSNTPAAIIETGFLNLDRDILEKHPDLLAQGIGEGILCFLHNEDVTLPSPQVTTTSQPTP
jgi:N-acetylmuramoyl-L-alanine amidase